MSLHKPLSLKEARKNNKLGRFIKEHPSEGDAKQFEDLLRNMTYNIKKPSKGAKTLKKE